MSPAKSQAIWLYDWRRREAPPPGLCLDINGQNVEVGLRMKHLGLTIDSQWTFRPHFMHLVPKVTAAANAYVACCWLSVGPGSKRADYMRESSVPGSCTSDLHDDPGDNIERCSMLKFDLTNGSLRMGEDAGVFRQQFEFGPGTLLLGVR